MRTLLIASSLAAAAVLSGAATWLLVEGDRVAPAGASVAAAERAPVATEPGLAALRADLAQALALLRDGQLGPATACATHVDVERELGQLRAALVQAGDEVEGLHAQVAELRRALGDLARAAVPPGPAYSEVLAAKPDTDWIAVERLAADWTRDPEATGASLRLLAPHEVLARFGPPTRISGDEGETRWDYIADGGGLRATIALRDAHVASLRVLDVQR